ncbi:pentapeptide repeat-containing protein [Magnetospirillum sp. UT-4]|uniref:pentapeptide repeat-containing protein n=1 Tax=Magnetospirillum sp. UT-4 TaxID=2681467 RepID=UPI00137F9103|nr:pentapeptide repeat-containing protein [Magnetospirillum sp. UT-4]CAA7625257.1 conserved hypothetical protein [Magnetospirillum sp. UT-4]
MGNVHHLQHLGQGLGDWNAWRLEEPDVRPDLTNANLRGANLAGMDLSESLLSMADLRKAILCGANLRNCNLPRCSLEEADLSGAKLQGANLAGANLLRANVSGANMRLVNLAGANLAGKMDLSGVDLTGANLAGAKLMGANFSGATLTGANLAGADARNANFTGADLTDAVTAGTLMDGANMAGAVIRRTPGRAAPGAARPGTDAAVLPQSSPQDNYGDADAPVPFGAEPDPIDELIPPMGVDDGDIGSGSLDTPAPPLGGDGMLDPSQISSLLEDIDEDDSALESGNLSAVEDDDQDDDTYFIYQVRDMAILALYFDQVSRKTKAEKAMLLDLLAQYNRNFIGQDVSVPITTSGNAILVGFANPTDALRCGGRYIAMLRDMHVESFVAINWSTATVRVDPEGHKSDELVAHSISPAARLMPVGVVGEVLVLEELYSHPDTLREQFTFERVARKWTAANDHCGEGIDVICYSVRGK